MTDYRVLVYESPHRRVRAVRRFRAGDVYRARGMAVRAVDQWALRARVARYRITWALEVFEADAIDWRRVVSGRLVPAAERREGEQ